MIHIIVGLIIICIIELIIILWLSRNNNEKKKIQDSINFFRALWGKFVIYVLATSIIGLFLASFICGSKITLSTMNEWVSLVLGLVALLIGIISLFLSFYNVDQSNVTQEKTVDIINNFREDITERMHKLQKDVENKIEESGEKTRSEVRGQYRTHDGMISSVNMQKGENSWGGKDEKFKF